MATQAKEWVEFTPDFSERLTGKAAVAAAIKYRFSVYNEEIPYYTKGLTQDMLFRYGVRPILEMEGMRLLKDLTTRFDVTEDGRVVTADCIVELPAGVRG